MITFTKNEPHKHPPYYACMVGLKCIGMMEQEVDGFYYFFPSPYTGGFWQQEILQDLSDKLKELNASWLLMLEKALSQESATD